MTCTERHGVACYTSSVVALFRRGPVVATTSLVLSPTHSTRAVVPHVNVLLVPSAFKTNHSLTALEVAAWLEADYGLCLVH